MYIFKGHFITWFLDLKKKVNMFLDVAGLVSVGCGFIFEFCFFFI